LKQLDLRRHASRDPNADRLSPDGRAHAETVGRTLPADYARVFVSPAERAAETVAWFLRGSGQKLPPHAVIEGLAGKSDEVAKVVGGLFDRFPDGARALAVGHTPLIEDAVAGLTGVSIQQLAECEGVRLTLNDDETYSLEELRL